MHNVRKKLKKIFGGGWLCPSPCRPSWRPRHSCSLCPTDFLVPSTAYGVLALLINVLHSDMKETEYVILCRVHCMATELIFIGHRIVRRCDSAYSCTISSEMDNRLMVKNVTESQGDLRLLPHRTLSSNY